MARDAIALGETEIGVRPGHERDHVAMRDDHALGRAGRSGGEQEVSRVVAATSIGRRLGRERRRVGFMKRRSEVAGIGRHVAHPDQIGPLRRVEPRYELAQQRHRRRRCQENAALGGAEDLLQPCRGTFGVERDVDRAGLQARQHAGDRCRRFRQQQPDAIAAAGALAQQPCQPIGARLQPLVGHAQVAVDEGCRLRATLRLMRHILLQRARHQPAAINLGPAWPARTPPGSPSVRPRLAAHRE
jgi:hypothetical protein